MNQNAASIANQLPVALEIDLVIDQHKTVRSRVGGRARAIRVRIDPSVELVFLSEITLPNTLPCLRRLMQPATAGVWLLSAHLECPPPEPSARRRAPSLAVLESGCCFLTADEQKIPIATFANQAMHPTYVDMQLLPPTNLLDFLLAENFTVEISGVNRRCFTHPLLLSLALNFGTQPPTYRGATRMPQHTCAAT